MKTLLDRIISNSLTDDKTAEEYRVSYNDAFLALAEISVTDSAESQPRNTEEQYFSTIFSELFKEIKFYYGQYKSIYQIGYSRDKADYIRLKIEIILDSIREVFAVVKHLLWEQLNSKNVKDRETAVFTISCIAKDSDAAKDSSHLFENFVTCPDESLKAYIRAFQYSTDSGIENKLVQVINTTTRVELVDACQTILNFRKSQNINKPESAAFTLCKS
jgi:uncharacterized protein (DUF2235 family)